MGKSHTYKRRRKKINKEITELEKDAAKISSART
jgi:hypothetical protein